MLSWGFRVLGCSTSLTFYGISKNSIKNQDDIPNALYLKTEVKDEMHGSQEVNASLKRVSTTATVLLLVLDTSTVSKLSLPTFPSTYRRKKIHLYQIKKN